MQTFESQYLALVELIRNNGEPRPDRTGTGVASVFSPAPIRVPLQYREGSNSVLFPLLETKRVPWKSVVAETLWFLQGRTDLESLREDGCTWWDEWELPDGTIGRGYGHQLRYWENRKGEVTDQLSDLIDGLKNDPYSRRHVMTMWNPGELDEMALPPCHGVYIQFYSSGNALDCYVQIRSSDVFLGLPTNIPSYALVLSLVAQVSGHTPRQLTVALGDAHIYNNHVEQVDTMLGRREEVSKRTSDFPRLFIDPSVKNIDDFRMYHFEVEGYHPLPTIPAPVAV